MLHRRTCIERKILKESLKEGILASYVVGLRASCFHFLRTLAAVLLEVEGWYLSFYRNVWAHERPFSLLPDRHRVAVGRLAVVGPAGRPASGEI